MSRSRLLGLAPAATDAVLVGQVEQSAVREDLRNGATVTLPTHLIAAIERQRDLHDSDRASSRTAMRRPFSVF